MSLLKDQIAVITGAGRGIGQAIAAKFASEGADVVCVELKNEFAEQTAQKVKEAGRKSWIFECNVSDANSVAQAAEKILEATGRIDILVNNAGITRDNLLMRMSEAEWDAVLDTNLKGTFLFTKAFCRAFLKQRSGRIVNIASVIGLMGNAGQCNYGASKAGVIGFTKCVARELASRGITANAIAPGFIETAMTAALGEEIRQQLQKQIPLGTLGQPEDVANTALFLASPLAKYITGQVIPVDGGMAM